MRKKTCLYGALLLLFALTLSPKTQAQYSYDFGIGLKSGSPLIGVTAKGFIGNQSALEGLVHFGSFGVGFVALYEYHLYFSNAAPGLRWYFGGGGHIATGKKSVYNPYANAYYSGLYAGVDGVIGLEYVFKNIPLSISVDAIPLLNFVDEIFLWWNAGVSVRYVIK